MRANTACWLAIWRRSHDNARQMALWLSADDVVSYLFARFLKTLSVVTFCYVSMRHECVFDFM